LFHFFRYFDFLTKFDEESPTGIVGKAVGVGDERLLSYCLPQNNFLFPTTNKDYPVDRIVVFSFDETKEIKETMKWFSLCGRKLEFVKKLRPVFKTIDVAEEFMMKCNKNGEIAVHLIDVCSLEGAKDLIEKCGESGFVVDSLLKICDGKIELVNEMIEKCGGNGVVANELLKKCDGKVEVAKELIEKCGGDGVKAAVLSFCDGNEERANEIVLKCGNDVIAFLLLEICGGNVEAAISVIDLGEIKIKCVFIFIFLSCVLYDTDNHEKSTKEFHRRCDLKGPTLIIAKNGDV
jgi:hypothetical protein